jgi:solute carrier family 12 (potassium/chloride transporters), member 9
MPMPEPPQPIRRSSSGRTPKGTPRKHRQSSSGAKRKSTSSAQIDLSGISFDGAAVEGLDKSNRSVTNGTQASHPKMGAFPRPVGGQQKLGTFSGVFVPTTLNVLSILMFLRFGFILGQTGFLAMMGKFIFLLLHISLLV